MSIRWPYIVAAVLAVVGIILIIIGGVLVAVFNNKINNLEKENRTHHLIPTNGSDAFNAWMEWSHFNPIYRYFYFFQVDSPEEVVKSGKNITVREIGPYVYRVKFERKKVAVDDPSTLSYELYKTYSFEKSRSRGDENDVINIVNLPILNLAMRLRFENSEVQSKVSEEIDRMKESLFSRVKVSDALWGYSNKHLNFLLMLLKSYYGLHPLNDSTYGLLYQSGQKKRETFQGSFEADIGEIENLWNIKKWNGQSSLNVWNNIKCNLIAGTDGYSWPPNINNSTQEFIFDSEWCRSIKMDLDETAGEKSGDLNTSTYFFANRTFSYASGVNKGFCQPTPKNATCLKDGVLNVTKCKDNIPLVLSQPHFLGADPDYINEIKGLRPNENKHKTTFTLEKVSGEVVEASRKMQLNAYVTNLKSFPSTENFTETVVPVVWMEERYSMTEDERNALNPKPLRREYDIIQYTLIGVGLLLLIIAVIVLVTAILYQRLKPTGDAGERQPLLH